MPTTLPLNVTLSNVMVGRNDIVLMPQSQKKVLQGNPIITRPTILPLKPLKPAYTDESNLS